MSEDLFDDLFNLEDNYYQDGYRLGVEDGSRAGRIEGRTFGLEKGFEKFFEIGRLQGTSQIWSARLPPQSTSTQNNANQPAAESEKEARSGQVNVIKMLPDNDRLAKHIRTLSALTELESLSTENTEDAVSEFDDRLKRAAAKVRVIETIIGERGLEESPTRNRDTKQSGVKLSRALVSAEKNIEDFGVHSPRGS
jgi:hypothetical protein